MSFSSNAKEEMIRLPLGKNCCMLSELSALTMTNGSLQFLGGGRVRVTWRMESAGLAKRMFMLLRERLQMNATVQYVRTSRYGGKRVSVLTVENEEAQRLLLALHMMEEDPEGGISLRRTSPRHTLTRQCCARAFLRGAYLGCGTMSTPEKGYHLEWVCQDAALRQSVIRVLEKLELPVHEHQRGEQKIIYLKSAQQISDCLAMMGASGAMLEMENIRIRKQLHSQVNRAAGCDEHNTERSLAAAESQTAWIHALALRQGLDSLPQALREAARLRIDHPEASLQELGQLAQPPVGKSAMGNRLRRLKEISESSDSVNDEVNQL